MERHKHYTYTRKNSDLRLNKLFAYLVQNLYQLVANSLKLKYAKVTSSEIFNRFYRVGFSVVAGCIDHFDRSLNSLGAPLWFYIFLWGGWSTKKYHLNHYKYIFKYVLRDLLYKYVVVMEDNIFLCVFFVIQILSIRYIFHYW